MGSLIKELLRLVRSRRGNNKGKVEGMVKYSRSNFMTPIPAAASVDEASVYRLLRAHDLINSPAFIVVKAPNEFKLSRMYQTGTLYVDGRLHLPGKPASGRDHHAFAQQREKR
ncbi:hypothetical protein DBIPINDM_003343 [Mesorhizobium sp. AR02]|uniref:hypothetical protein n=1 Tax=Mesorhizobium sp. AR02 TaxID=2865837 RepID=UPI00215DFD71|nr:hypothetical protein [Mesorhizobium sp. AR02]UVK57277.1 hypothetical protein DBIPINDM_003343 [Mesorhizobium sp. AR02]